MMEKRVDAIAHHAGHYLVRAKKESHSYWAEFLKAASVLKAHMTPNEYEYWSTEKMLLKDHPFKEKTFIQYAFETAVVRFCMERFPMDLKTEVKVNPASGKDVDVQFKEKGFTYNLEMKCAEYGAKEKLEGKDAYLYSTVGRIPDRQDPIRAVSSAIDEGTTSRGEERKSHLENKNMDNNLKDFLLSAHSKFCDTTTEEEVNVLVVGCAEAMDIQHWHYYMFAEQGLFTANSFTPHSEYNNVDVVILTNQYFKHNKFYQKNVKNCWTVEQGFNLIYSNPYRKLPKEAAILNLIQIIPNYSEELNRYRVPASSDVPSFVMDAVRIHTFVVAELEKNRGLYLFEEKKTLPPPDSSPK